MKTTAKRPSDAAWVRRPTAVGGTDLPRGGSVARPRARPVRRRWLCSESVPRSGNRSLSHPESLCNVCMGPLAAALREIGHIQYVRYRYRTSRIV